MTRVGCTGHQRLSPVTRRRVAQEIAAALLRLDGAEPILGLSSLAAGADQCFALAVLAAGGRIHAVLPSEGYEGTFVSHEDRRQYLSLLSLSDEPTTLAFPHPDEDAYLAAGKHVADNCDVLLAIWDGQPAAGRGGTGDIVAYARARGVEVHVIWPEGSTRD